MITNLTSWWHILWQFTTLVWVFFGGVYRSFYIFNLYPLNFEVTMPKGHCYCAGIVFLQLYSPDSLCKMSIRMALGVSYYPMKHYLMGLKIERWVFHLVLFITCFIFCLCLYSTVVSSLIKLAWLKMRIPVFLWKFNYDLMAILKGMHVKHEY